MALIASGPINVHKAVAVPKPTPLTDSITVHTARKHLQPRVCTDNGDRPISIEGISVLVDGMNE